MKRMILILILMLSITGCADQGGRKNLDSETLAKPLLNFFQGDITKITRIDIRNGATGEVKSFKNKETLQKWLGKFRDIEVKSDPNQEPKTGYAYAVELYEGNQIKFSFTNSQIDKLYLLPSEELIKHMKSLYES
ncbi:hypothetical protein PC41400_04050 [Paenibacillus chitinolyticus]|uniref:Lipoprotein n=1 Tax=Paenibacillus chitinolyticus TaxID=79263 RepID=A0A410WRC6_9BACL|nr:hypothetical protein [Paenibacillus chitinolyticus]MCY9591503.1 hypothetical protein [Paenibacillus chitinolyticus]MCY9594664.1 hypothetical protein [Paenibacillus chitinolyticus]QAV16901.1 hypothetical protein PC41400_04050 [Paenibacillus chitinolyticus]GKS12184.1 hypothetical protein YDYSY3_31840 [Paenibacillus chitinolyticus]